MQRGRPPAQAVRMPTALQQTKHSRRRRTERNQACYSQLPQGEPAQTRKSEKSKRNWKEIFLLVLGLIMMGLQQGVQKVVSTVKILAEWLKRQLTLVVDRRRNQQDDGDDLPFRYSGYVPPPPEGVRRSTKHRHTRHFYYGDGKCRRFLTSRRLLMGCLGLVLVISLWNIIGYWSELQQSRAISEALREAYYAELAAQTPMPTAVPTPIATTTPKPTPTLEPRATATPAPTTPVLLTTVAYPDNPYASVRSRFSKIQRQNEDIVGWLTIQNVIDEAVVQKDNSYYLRRDYRGYHNDNGAIFMEQSIRLRKSRPYTLILYGHNMRSGAMFGCLRNFENIYYYRKNAFVTFDTAYEDGRYVIFAVGTLSQKENTRNYVNISKLLSSRIIWRDEAIAQLERNSVISSRVDVNVDDQILVLITCVEDEAERRFVAARRIRENESEEQVQKLVDKSREK